MTRVCYKIKIKMGQTNQQLENPSLTHPQKKREAFVYVINFILHF